MHQFGRRKIISTQQLKFECQPTLEFQQLLKKSNVF